MGYDYYSSTPRHCWMFVDRICIVYIYLRCALLPVSKTIRCLFCFVSHLFTWWWLKGGVVVGERGSRNRYCVYSTMYVHANIIMRYASVDVTPESYLPLFYHFICLCVCIWFYLAWLGSFFSPPAFQLLFFFNSPNKERNSIFYSMPAL